jgi:hypothetical protein
LSRLGEDPVDTNSSGVLLGEAEASTFGVAKEFGQSTKSVEGIVRSGAEVLGDWGGQCGFGGLPRPRHIFRSNVKSNGLTSIRCCQGFFQFGMQAEKGLEQGIRSLETLAQLLGGPDDRFGQLIHHGPGRLKFFVKLQQGTRKRKVQFDLAFAFRSGWRNVRRETRKCFVGLFLNPLKVGTLYFPTSFFLPVIRVKSGGLTLGNGFGCLEVRRVLILLDNLPDTAGQTLDDEEGTLQNHDIVVVPGRKLRPVVPVWRADRPRPRASPATNGGNSDQFLSHIGESPFALDVVEDLAMKQGDINGLKIHMN